MIQATQSGQAGWSEAFWLLSETRLAEISHHRQQTVADGTSGWWFLMIPVVAGIIACGIQFYASRRMNRLNRPDELFDELCRVHRIGAHDRRLLYKVAQAANLQHPSELFVGELTFDRAANEALSKRAIQWHQHAAMDLLRPRLFDQAPV
jgi:hypothetical protein